MDEKISDVLDKVGLKSKGFKMPFEMSGGEQKRIEVARARLNSHKLIPADEPTGNLDPETSDEIMQLLFQISRDYGTSIIMATHDYRVINKFPARMLKTERGKVIDNASISIDSWKPPLLNPPRSIVSIFGSSLHYYRARRPLAFLTR